MADVAAERTPTPRRRWLRAKRLRVTIRPAVRSGVATIDYVLILAVIMPLVLMAIIASRQILGLAFEFLCVLVSWPFM
jgi:hypothetical protein